MEAFNFISNKALKTIKSCKTDDQLKTAKEYCYLALKKFSNENKKIKDKKNIFNKKFLLFQKVMEIEIQKKKSRI